jgi:hypothetical protein
MRLVLEPQVDRRRLVLTDLHRCEPDRAELAHVPGHLRPDPLGERPSFHQRRRQGRC